MHDFCCAARGAHPAGERPAKFKRRRVIVDIIIVIMQFYCAHFLPDNLYAPYGGLQEND